MYKCNAHSNHIKDTHEIHRRFHFILRRCFPRRFISESNFLRSNLLNDLQQLTLRQGNFFPKSTAMVCYNVFHLFFCSFLSFSFSLVFFKTTVSKEIFKIINHYNFPLDKIFIKYMSQLIYP